MRRKFAILTGIIMIMIGVFSVNLLDVYAAGEKETLTGKAYDLGEKDEYEISKAENTKEEVSRFYLVSAD